MSNAIVITEHGGPEVLRWQPVDEPEPAPHQVRLRHTRIGVHYHDVYVRSGEYHTLPLPGIPGIEAVGVVDAVGQAVSGWGVGERVAYVTGTYGCYASDRVIDPGVLLRIPDDLDDIAVASMLLRGLTVDMLTRAVHCIREGESVLVHAAAGGMGQLLARGLRAQGATVVGAVRSDEQARRASEAGSHHVVRYDHPGWEDAVLSITNDRGVDVVYDGVGASTFDASLRCAAFCGHVVNFGQASGPIAPFGLARLAAKSLTLSRPILFHYLRDRAGLERSVQRVFEAIRKGVLKVGAPREFALRDAAYSHRAIERGGAATPLLLVP